MADFTPVPAGTPAAAALVLRGPDPDIVSVVGTNFQVMVSANCGERPGPLANKRLVAYSTTCGQFRRTLFTRDAALLSQPAYRVAASPSKFEENVEQLVTDGMDNAMPLG